MRQFGPTSSFAALRSTLVPSVGVSPPTPFGPAQPRRTMVHMSRHAVSASTQHRASKHVDPFQEHVVEPACVQGGRCLAPAVPGVGAELVAASLHEWEIPPGAGWQRVGERAVVTNAQGVR